MERAQPKREERMDFRVSEEHKRLIEDAAALNGVTFSSFAVSTLVQTAREVLAAHGHTRLSQRDAQRFLAILDDEQPTSALKKAAQRYKTRHGG